MAFPVNSTSTNTVRNARFQRVMQRSSVRSRITHAGVFNCRQTAGSSKWSPHARGDATDLFGKTADLEAIAHNAVLQATKKTLANRGVKVKLVHVIYGSSEWIAGRGWGHYSGVPHTTHVHTGFSFSSEVKPPCAA